MRLLIALSVAAVLAVFLLYTTIAGNGRLQLQPSQLVSGQHREKVTLTGKVLGPVTGDAHGGGLRFRLKDRDGKQTVRVVYRGDVPDMFKEGREISVDGRLAHAGVFQGEAPLVTKCPSKYTPKR